MKRIDSRPGLLLAGMVGTLLVGCAPTSFLVTAVPARQDQQEIVVRRESFFAGDRIAIIPVEGMIQNGRTAGLLGLGEPNPVVLFKERLDKAAADSRVKAVVLRINSPGGTVTGSELMYHELCRFRESTGKPVIACIMDLGASGGYYLACGADQIYVQPTTVTGSIGVIMITPDLSGTMNKIGVKTNVFKSGDLKDAGSPFREMRPQDEEMFQRLVAGMYARFLDVVIRSRSAVPAEQIKALADGRVMLGPEAKAAGLVDEVGDIEAAIAAAKAAAGIADRKIVLIEYDTAYAWRPNAYALGNPAPAQVNLVNVELPVWLRSESPQFLYMWLPGW